MVTFRLATDQDIPSLADIERAAGRLFHEVGMPEIADDAPPPDDVLAAGVADQRLWVAEDSSVGCGPIAYLLAVKRGDTAHIEQVSVRPSCARRGIGARLVAICATWADSWGATSLTLTTFRDVPWNAPYYQRLGFRIVSGDDIPEDVRQVVEEERRAGLHHWPRVVMKLVDRGELPSVVTTRPPFC